MLVSELILALQEQPSTAEAVIMLSDSSELDNLQDRKIQDVTSGWHRNDPGDLVSLLIHLEEDTEH